MAYVSMPKDLGKVKTKLAFNLTKRQIICFGLAMLVGYLFYKYSSSIESDLRLYLMMAVISPFVIAGVYEKDGVSFEQYLKYRYESQILHPKTRIYSSKNLYIQITDVKEKKSTAKGVENINGKFIKKSKQIRKK